LRSLASSKFLWPVKERGKDNRVMLKALLGLIGRPWFEHSKGYRSNSRVGLLHDYRHALLNSIEGDNHDEPNNACR
jgi:hypothetical protein